MNNIFEPEKSTKKQGMRESYEARRLFDPDCTIISNSAYNAIIGIAIAIGFVVNFVMAYNFTSAILSIPIVAVIIAYFILSFVGMYVVHKSSSAFVSAVGFLCLVVGMGLLLTFFLNTYELSSVYLAFGITAGITVLMTILASIFPDFFMSIGKTLMISLIICIIVEVICSFFFRGALQILDYVVILLFCGFIGFDWARAQKYQKTVNNAIDAAADIYVDIVNVLIRVLEIVGKSKN